MAAARSARSLAKDDVRERFNYNLMQATENGWKPACQDRPEEFTDYHKSPSKEVAEALCAGCPMRAGDNICREYAQKTNVTGIVMGGIAWVGGKPQEPSTRRRGKAAVELAA